MLVASRDVTSPRLSPLHERHLALGAKTADFGGWDMPIEYAGGGVVAEHTAVRDDVGVFDVSHLGTVTVRGDGARALVDRVFTNDLAEVSAWEAQYTLLLDDAGGVVDDLIVYLRADDDVLLVPNAANAAEVVRVVAAAAPAGVEVRDVHADVAVIAVQGPRSTAVLQVLGLPTEHAYMSFVDARWAAPGGGAEIDVVVCRSGYTGELGFELLVASADAGALWDAVLAHDVRPCGLGARDTLRTEMGYPLHGHELSTAIDPREGGVGWAVGWSKPEFRGRDAVLARRAAGPPARVLRGLRALERAIPRAGMTVRVPGASTVAGEITSGTFSPTLKAGIALALLAPEAAATDEVEVDVRGRSAGFAVVKPPFVPSHVR
jgi:aminomethyltransferase